MTPQDKELREAVDKCKRILTINFFYVSEEEQEGVQKLIDLAQAKLDNKLVIPRDVGKIRKIIIDNAIKISTTNDDHLVIPLIKTAKALHSSIGTQNEVASKEEIRLLKRELEIKNELWETLRDERDKLQKEALGTQMPTRERLIKIIEEYGIMGIRFNNHCSVGGLADIILNNKRF